MGRISVAEAADRLGVGVSRIHQRIGDGSLRAERIGAQWVVDEASLVWVAESRRPGRPLSRRSAWALMVAGMPGQGVMDDLAPSEQIRARQRLCRLLAASEPEAALSEAQVQAVAVLLRSLLRNRAERCLYRAAPPDLPDLRDDDRVALSGPSHPRSGIASGDLVEGYVAAEDIDKIIDDHLLSAAASDREANVVLRVVSAIAWQHLRDAATWLLAADLADHRRPREEARAAELVREMACQHAQLLAEWRGYGPDGREDRS